MLSAKQHITRTARKSQIYDRREYSRFLCVPWFWAVDMILCHNRDYSRFLCVPWFWAVNMILCHNRDYSRFLCVPWFWAVDMILCHNRDYRWTMHYVPVQKMVVCEFSHSFPFASMSSLCACLVFCANILGANSRSVFEEAATYHLGVREGNSDVQHSGLLCCIYSAFKQWLRWL